MTELAPCTRCNRHVVITEVACPFCTAVLPPSKMQRFIPRNISRAALFAAALTGTACDQGAKPLANPSDKVGSAATPRDAGIDALTPADIERIRREGVEPQPLPAKPYGAPPARRRFV